MKVKVAVCMAGHDYAWKPGDVVTIEDRAEATRLLEAGFVLPIVEKPEVSVPVVEKRGKGK